MDTKQKVFEDIKRIRLELRLKQREIAKLLGINQYTFANYEVGRTMPPADRYLDIMALRGRTFTPEDLR